jgi:Ca2+-binding RTX toxin-like protein
LLDGGDGADALAGGQGDDVLTGGSGADRFDGGPGVDIATNFNAAEGDTKVNIP